MNSPYPYNVSNIISWDEKKSKKYMKALVYDFLKKKRKLGFYYDAYTTFHSGIKTADEIKKLGLPDSDGDGLLDGWEVANSLNPLSAAGDDGRPGDSRPGRRGSRRGQRCDVQRRNDGQVCRLCGG